MKRKTILVLANSISPVRGSEFSVGWNYVREMSVSNSLIVLYGYAGDHLGDIEEVENSDLCRNMPNVRFIPVSPGFLANLLNLLNKKGIFAYSFYLAYKLWHRRAYKAAVDIAESNDIDLIHYLCPIGYREPGYLWKIDKPYIWGPIGGARNRPVKIISQKNTLAGIKAALYNLVNSIQFRFDSRVRVAFRRSDLLISSTTEICRLIRDVHHVYSEYLPENGITSEMLNNQRLVEVVPGERVKIIWVGRIDEMKALDILLAALSLVKNSNWHLHVIGGGPLLDKCIKMSERLGIGNQITWVGKVPRDAVNRYYRESHLHALTSLAEANTTVIWEAMSHGIPTITLDHCGMHDTVCEKCGMRIAVGTLEATVESYAECLDRLISDPRLIAKLSQGVLECSGKFSWARRKALWEGFYDAAIANWRNKAASALKSF